MTRLISFRSAFALAGAFAMVFAFWLPAESTQASGVSAALICEPGVGGAICEAAPFNPSYSYAWYATGGLTLSSGNFIKQVGCTVGNGGTVTVTVTAPGVGSDSASRYISCSGPGGNPPWNPPGGF